MNTDSFPHVRSCLWSDVEDLFLNHYCTNFWSDADVVLPYGQVMVIDPDDMPSMFWSVDLDSIDAKDLFKDAVRLQNIYQRPIGFAISKTWSGDVSSFRGSLSSKNFEKIGSTHWLTCSLQSVPHGRCLDPSYSIETADDLELVAGQMADGFGPKTGQLFLEGARRYGPDPRRAYFVVRHQVTGTPVGSAAVFVHNGLAYLSGLSVSPDHRKRGIATALVNARFAFALKAGAAAAVTCVWHNNTASLATQMQAGYQLLEEVEYWMPSSLI